MVVSSVHTLPINDGLSGPQMVELYTRQLEALGAKKTGTFSVECESYHSNPAITTANETRVLSLITASEYPASAFSIIEKSTGSSGSAANSSSNPSASNNNSSTTSTSSSSSSSLANSCTVVTDSSFEQILTNLALFYSKKVHVRMEVRGQRWTLADFVIKLGTCTMGGNQTFKAICWDLIKELGQTFVGASIHQPQTHLMARMNELFYPVDAIHQYSEIFTQLRKGGNVGGGGGGGGILGSKLGDLGGGNSNGSINNNISNGN
ncbi:mediator complex subunit Med20 [Tyrophagus putrescentiae]|nr:mediator complex subunit Med20 [Tyrophagus putrescentiae]